MVQTKRGAMYGVCDVDEQVEYTFKWAIHVSSTVRRAQ